MKGIHEFFKKEKNEKECSDSFTDPGNYFCKEL